jgi:ornithine--oxo-acid transaminase
MISDADCTWIEESFEATIAAAHKVPGAVWSLGKTLADHAIKARAMASTR